MWKLALLIVLLLIVVYYVNNVWLVTILLGAILLSAPMVVGSAEQLGGASSGDERQYLQMAGPSGRVKQEQREVPSLIQYDDGIDEIYRKMKLLKQWYFYDASFNNGRYPRDPQQIKKHRLLIKKQVPSYDLFEKRRLLANYAITILESMDQLPEYTQTNIDMMNVFITHIHNIIAACKEQYSDHPRSDEIHCGNSTMARPVYVYQHAISDNDLNFKVDQPDEHTVTLIDDMLIQANMLFEQRFDAVRNCTLV